MDNQRVILFLALAIVVLFMWDAWEKKNNPQPVAQQTFQPATPSAAPSTDNASPSADMPEVAAQSPASEPQVGSQSTMISEQRIRVVTDVLDVDLESVGGDLRRAFLLDFPIDLKEKQPFPLMDDNLPQLFIAQSGFLSSMEAPDHRSRYTAQKTD
ncbi:MAG: membrane protein insertase YidC, partial [Gammaproteobacteria bacterium]|nr:membrane protein insertase YidC [Gammaproteobacteria bacterium]